MKTLAKFIADGIRAGDTSVKKLGIDHATAQRVYRLMKADEYEGSLSFYVCEKLCDEVLGKTKDGLRMMDNIGQNLPSTESIVSRIDFEKDKDVLFCAMIGATIQSTDKVGKKCLDIIYHLYAS